MTPSRGTVAGALWDRSGIFEAGPFVRRLNNSKTLSKPTFTSVRIKTSEHFNTAAWKQKSPSAVSDLAERFGTMLEFHPHGTRRNYWHKIYMLLSFHEVNSLASRSSWLPSLSVQQQKINTVTCLNRSSFTYFKVVGIQPISTKARTGKCVNTRRKYWWGPSVHTTICQAPPKKK